MGKLAAVPGLLDTLLEVGVRSGNRLGRTAVHDDKLEFSTANNVPCRLKPLTTESEKASTRREEANGVPLSAALRFGAGTFSRARPPNV